MTFPLTAIDFNYISSMYYRYLSQTNGKASISNENLYKIIKSDSKAIRKLSSMEDLNKPDWTTTLITNPKLLFLLNIGGNEVNISYIHYIGKKLEYKKLRKCIYTKLI